MTQHQVYFYYFSYLRKNSQQYHPLSLLFIILFYFSSNQAMHLRQTNGISKSKEKATNMTIVRKPLKRNIYWTITKYSTIWKEKLPFFVIIVIYWIQRVRISKKFFFIFSICTFCKWEKVLAGILHDLSVGQPKHGTNIPGAPSFQYNKYSGNDGLNKVHLNLTDNIVHKRNETIEFHNQILSNIIRIITQHKSNKPHHSKTGRRKQYTEVWQW